MTQPRTTAKTTGILAGLTTAVLAFTGCSSDSPSSQAKPSAPPYKITAQNSRGMHTYVTVEVDSTKNLKAVFDAVRADLTDDAGYFVSINCSTGSTDTYEHRLANGKYAVGSKGAASTGLDEGGTEFETVKGATCP